MRKRKPGPKPLPDSQIRSCRFIALLTPVEAKMLREHMRRAGVSTVSDVLRRALLGQEAA